MGKQELCQPPAEGQGSCGFSLGDVPAKLGVHVLSTLETAWADLKSREVQCVLPQN